MRACGAGLKAEARARAAFYGEKAMPPFLKTAFLLFCLLCAPFPALTQESPRVKPGDSLRTELWEGKILTARFRAGMCFEPDGKARGVLILTHKNGNEDVYHLYGEMKDGRFDLSHSSGHRFYGSLTEPDKMEGGAKLSGGMKLSLKGSRKRDVTLKAPDCAPLF